RIVIPPTLRNDILDVLHSAHQGVSGMIARAQATVFWPGITYSIQSKRDCCCSCNRNAPSNARLPPIQPHIPVTPFECLFADYFEFRGWNYLVIGDRLSGWTEAYRIKSGTSEISAKGLVMCLRKLFTTFGVPEEISTDGGPQFTSGETKEFLQQWGITHRISSAHHPQSNGRAELAVKSTKRLLENNVGPNGDLNNNAFMRAMLNIRNTPDPICQLSPAQILFGHPIRDAMPRIKTRVPMFDNDQFLKTWRHAWSAKEEALRTRYAKTLESLQEHTRFLAPLLDGDSVFIQNQVGNHPKKWDRSGKIVECKGNDQYVIKVEGTGRLTVRNRKFLRKFLNPLKSHETEVALSKPLRTSYNHEDFADLPQFTEYASESNKVTSYEPNPALPAVIPPPLIPAPTASASPLPTSPLPTTTVTLLSPIPMPSSINTPHLTIPPLLNTKVGGDLKRSTRVRIPKKFYEPESGRSLALEDLKK
ncbi:MAG: DDE-type integrase/transposase/recombinase, partial [Rickettsiales bacterium]|nr:DDE-type integrase/transposase/recombinase [Rickettsiales bacterium]